MLQLSLIVFVLIYGYCSGCYVSLIAPSAAQLGPTSTVGTRLGSLFFIMSIGGVSKSYPEEKRHERWLDKLHMNSSWEHQSLASSWEAHRRFNGGQQLASLVVWSLLESSFVLRLDSVPLVGNFVARSDSWKTFISSKRKEKKKKTHPQLYYYSFAFTANCYITLLQFFFVLLFKQPCVWRYAKLLVFYSGFQLCWWRERYNSYVTCCVLVFDVGLCHVVLLWRGL